LYHQLKEELRRFIESGQFAPHTALPSEPELVASYHVSRATVRQALNELAQEGLLYREHGRGTFVRERRVPPAISEITSLSEEIRRRGKQPGGLFIASELIRGSLELRTRLQLAEEEQIMRLERVRSVDGVPCAHEVDYLPYPRASGIYQQAKQVASGSLYAHMRAEGLIPSLAERTITGTAATSREAALLQATEGEAGLRVLCTTYDSTGSPIASSEAFFLGDRFAFSVTLPVAQPAMSS
jgi:GntR family transcriptional regulator